MQVTFGPKRVSGKYAVFFMLSLLLPPLISANPQAIQPRRLTLDEARELAHESLSVEARKLPGLDLENYKNLDFPDFYFFSATWGSPRSDQGGNIEQLAVDAITGDVWSGVVCREIKSSDLAKLQRSIRKKIGLGEQEYKKLRKKGPMC